MSKDVSEYFAIPTNIITGFLGVGKTTAILHLLSTKPETERWAVLVNEFGEIGIDGSLFRGQHPEEKGVFIREVPGGCMCCVAGLPMQVALNQLLRLAKPDRLLIEPSGLGHPLEVVDILQSEQYRDVLLLEKIVTLVDARNLKDRRYIDHETFNQQLSMADIVVGNKVELYDDGDREQLVTYIKQEGSNNPEVLFVTNGQISPTHLAGETATRVASLHHHHHEGEQEPLASDMPMPESGYVKAVNQGEGFYSIGWRFAPNKVFNYEKLLLFLNGITAERLKAVFITEKGIFGYNLTSDALTEVELDDCLESRAEIICKVVDQSWERQLMACTLNTL